jgi:Na+-transporting methylmalonyl-CoA/oxaloacetate decarboxylase gamma subunit
MDFSIGLALTLTVFGIVLTMFALYVINLMIRAMGRIFGEKAPSAAAVSALPAVTATVPVNDSVASDDGEQVVAVIAAAVTSFMQSAAGSALNVRPYMTSSAWGRASKDENTQNL